MFSTRPLMFSTRSVGTVALTISSLCLPLAAFAATKTWDGGGSDNYWSTAANWSDDTRPGTGDIILFDGTGKKNAIIGTTPFLYPIGELRMTTSNTGTLTVGKAITINNNLSISGGTLAVQGGSQITNKGGWINGGATFTAGTGTVLFTGSGDTYTLKETSTFRNLSLDDGLALYWKLDDGSGSTIARDSSQYGRDGSLSSFNSAQAWVSTGPELAYANQGSLRFTSNNQEVSNGNMSQDQRLTYASWVYPTSPNCNIFTRSNQVNHYMRIWSGDNFIGGIRFTDSTTIEVDSSVVEYNDWYHVALSYDGAAVNLYVNGELVDSVTKTDSTVRYLGSGVNTFRLGHAGCSFIGDVSELRYYSRALSASEIETLASGEQGTGSGRYTLGSALTVNGNLNIYSGTLDASSSNYGITSSGSFTNNAGFNPRSSTLTLNGIGTNLKLYGASLYNLVISSAKSAILRSAATVTNALTVASSATLTLNGNDLTATSTTITNNGTITQGTGAILHSSTFSASPSRVDIGLSITATLVDTDANTDGTTQETVTLSTTDDTFTLTETTVNSGIFTAAIPTARGTGTDNDGILTGNGSCNQSHTLTYTDPEDATDTRSIIVTLLDPLILCEGETATDTPSGGGGTRGGPGRGGEAPVLSTPAPTPSTSNDTTTSPTTTDPPSTTTVFTDVRTTDWFGPAIKTLTSQGIFSGYTDEAGNSTGNFGPADPVTVGQILKIALLSAGKELPSSLPLPENPTATDWSSSYVSLAEQLNLDLASETSQRPATRGEVIRTLLQTFGIQSEQSSNPFSDLPDTHPYTQDILTALALGLVKGDDDASTVRPDDEINRAEIAVLVLRFMERMGE